MNTFDFNIKARNLFAYMAKLIRDGNSLEDVRLHREISRLSNEPIEDENPKIDTRLGRMEEPASVKEITAKLVEHMQKGGELRAELVLQSRNHNGKPMIVLSDKQPDGVSIWHLEISELGVFSYAFDDSVS